MGDLQISGPDRLRDFWLATECFSVHTAIISYEWVDGECENQVVDNALFSTVRPADGDTLDRPNDKLSS
ncbi:hypothetical protein, partial [Frankia sp. CiP3]|uniref:hypothetical protein n=1 Tax=Frankia sp. CiP3 TaxID=2880971 RepID=UPI001EF661C2